MKAMALLGAVLLTDQVVAKCVATTRTLVKFGVWQCQAVNIGRNYLSWQTYDSETQVKGALISGIVLESRSVLETARKPPGPVFEGPRLPAGARVTVFLTGQAEALCAGFDKQEPTWLITSQMCCDTLPATGACMVPDFIPVVEVTRPEGWHDHEAEQLP